MMKNTLGNQPKHLVQGLRNIKAPSPIKDLHKSQQSHPQWRHVSITPHILDRVLFTTRELKIKNQ